LYLSELKTAKVQLFFCEMGQISTSLASKVTWYSINC
jgi:hypothetical protein